MIRPSFWLAAALAATAPGGASAFGSLLPPQTAPVLGDSADELVRQGRRLLAEGQLEEAEATFTRAVAASDGDPAVRTWLVRSWIEQGHYQEALLASDELAAAGASQADLSYLRGLASFGEAKADIAQGTSGPFTQSQIEDAHRWLAKALAADAERYADARIPLAEAAWYSQALDEARATIDAVVADAPTEHEAWALRGKIAFSQYSAAREAEDDAAQTFWKAALESFEEVVRLCAQPAEPAQMAALAEAEVQIGHLHIWKQEWAEASAAYASAMAWDPGRVDFAQVQGSLGGESFAACTTRAMQLFDARHGADDARVATLAWWHGYGQLAQEEWEVAAQAFRRAVAAWPEYVSSWYWVFRSEYARGHYGSAIEGLREHWRAAPEGLLGMFEREGREDLERIDWLVGWCVDPGEQQGAARNVDAALLSEILTRAQPNESRHWNNLGLFLRDEGDRLRADPGEAVSPGRLQQLWLESYAAYTTALELEPENANYLNDLAVILHYYLRRDYERAQELYAEAERRAAAELARADLEPDERALAEIALRDAQDNQRRLALYLERLAAGEEVDPRDVR